MNFLAMEDNKAMFVKNLFNSLAKNYDVMNSLMTFGLDKFWRRLVVKYTGLKKGGKGLDVCCGTGMLTIEQARVAGGTGEILGLDFSEHMITVAMQNIKDFKFKERIKFIRGNVLNLPFDNNEFDCVTVGWGLRNVSNIEKALREMVRVVKPGGKVVSLDMAQLKIPGINYLYWLYLYKFVPALGALLCNNKKAYDYLFDSVKNFINQKELTVLFKKAGLIEASYWNLCGGVIAIVEGRKPDYYGCVEGGRKNGFYKRNTQDGEYC